MKKILVLFWMLSPLALALPVPDEDLNLDDFLSPDEILGEVTQGTWEFDFEALIEPAKRKPVPQSSAILSLQQSHQKYKLNPLNEYPLVVVINKATQGKTAQRMVVYRNGKRHGVFVVSTGREKPEVAKSGKRYTSVTPLGWFTPTRLVRNHVSATWQARMDFSIFFIGGIATHAAAKESLKDLGRRASGGCVRLQPQQARFLFDEVMSMGKGWVTRYDRSGKPLRNKKGQIQKIHTWKMLILVVNQPAA